VRLFTRHRGASGAIIRPDRSFTSRWPSCYICNKSVHAYGVENETAAYIEVWMECRGVEIDPATGRVVEDAPRKHELRRTSVRIEKRGIWSHQRFTQIMGDTIAFAPAGEGERDFVVEAGNAQSVRPT